MGLANITNNILVDSGILVGNLTPTSRNITINGVTNDLSADRSWTIATHDAVTIGTANGLSLSGQVLSLALASGSTTGALSSTDWNTFNNKQSALTNPVTGTGTNNYLPKFTGTSTIGNSQIFDNGTSVGVGVSTINVESKLSVGGGALIISGDTSANRQVLELTTSGGVSYIKASYVGSSSFGDLAFQTGTSVKMLLNTSGNLGLGVTPSAWASAYKSFDIGTTTSLYNAAGETLLGENVFVNTSYVDIYKTSDFATIYRQINGQHIWYQAPSGTAGNAISFTQAMTLDASGNLLLGTTSPLLSSSGRGNITINGSSSSILAFGIASALSGYIYSSSSNLELDAGGARFMQFNTNGAERMRITSGGNVGIGTTSPYVKLDVNGSIYSSGNLAASNGNQSANTVCATLFLGNRGYFANSDIGGAVISAISTGSFWYSGTAMAFYTNPGPDVTGTASVERMRILAGGEVCIGRTTAYSAGFLLNVQGNIYASAALNVGTSIQTGAPTNGTAQQWKLGNAVSGSTSTNSYIIVEINGTTYSIPALQGLP